MSDEDKVRTKYFVRTKIFDPLFVSGMGRKKKSKFNFLSRDGSGLSEEKSSSFLSGTLTLDLKLHLLGGEFGTLVSF